MQFVIIGAGSLGCVYGANLARIGEPVTLIDVWEDHVQSIQFGGLEIDGLSGAYNVAVHATTDPAKSPKADVALVSVNAYSTPAAAEVSRTVLKDSGYAVTL